MRCRTTGQRAAAHAKTRRGGTLSVRTNDGRVTNPTLVLVSERPDEPEPALIAHDDAGVSRRQPRSPLYTLKVLVVRDLLKLGFVKVLSEVQGPPEQRSLARRIEQ
jgi:hypothetical protein